MIADTATQTKRVLAVGRMYRGIYILCEGTDYAIYDESRRRYAFVTFAEACAFVDTWYAMRAAGEYVTFHP